MDRVILDTDVSSLSLKHRLPSPVLTRLIGKQPCITFVTLGELTQWAELRQWGRAQPRRAGELARRCDHPALPRGHRPDMGRISAAAIQRGRARPANDTWIAACALSYACRSPPSTSKTSRISPNTKLDPDHSGQLTPISTQPIRPSRQPGVLPFSVGPPRSADSDRRVPGALVAVICCQGVIDCPVHSRPRGEEVPESAVIITYMTVCLHSQSPLISSACQSQSDNGRDILSAQRDPLRA
jgi:predicted nucleic acid-binding protein